MRERGTALVAVEIGEELKAATVSTLLVVLRGDCPTRPVVNTSTLNH